MQGPHRTILTYFYGENDGNGDCPTLEVGEVACVPRAGEVVWIQDKAYVVEAVSWSPDRTGLPITWVGVDIVPRKKKKRSAK